MFYAEIDENSVCFHVMDNELPESERIIKVEDTSVLGKRYMDGEWVEVPQPETETEPTQLDRIEEALQVKNDELRQEGADAVTMELIERGIL